MRRCAILAAALLLTACSTQPKFSWVRPEGTSGRQMNQDVMVCRSNSGTAETQLAASVPGQGLGDALFNLGMIEKSKEAFDACMENAGYTRQPRE